MFPFWIDVEIPALMHVLTFLSALVVWWTAAVMGCRTGA